MAHRFHLRVYYEDTDLAGIVYYANYLKFVERARTEFARSHGIDQASLRRERGIVFAVRRVEADFLSPAAFDDQLVVETAPQSVGPARILLRQTVFRAGDRLFEALVTLVALSASGRPTRLPEEFRRSVESLLRQDGQSGTAGSRARAVRPE